jgi:POT family proton-dependent oligopeptide transporter
MASTVDKLQPAAGAGSLGGHPKGLFFLAFTELWERFSYYGMTALLALYMVSQLLLPGHVEHIVGFAELRAALESMSGPLSTQALASEVFGLYSGFVYFTPVLGGIIADRWIGQRNAVVIGALSLSAGHMAMAFDQSFLFALLLLVIGAGFLKGNISAQVGLLYPRDEEARRTHGFILFSTAINIGAVLGPLLCGFFGQRLGWHYGFGVAAIFMLMGLATYLYGYRHLPARVARQQTERSALSPKDRRTVAALLAVMLITVFQSIAMYQVFNVGAIWIVQHVALDVGVFRVPVPWYLSAYALSSIVGVPLLFWLWKQQATHTREPGDLEKIGTGAWITAGSNLILVVAIAVSGDAPVQPFWPLLYVAGLGIAFLYYWPTLLALVSRAAPASVNATLMGLAFMSLALSNTLIGWIGSWYEQMSPSNFWLMHAAIAGASGLLVATFGGRLSDEFLRPA